MKYRFLLLPALVIIIISLGSAVANAAATLYLTTDKTTFAIGDTFNVDVRIDTDSGINAAQATLQFPKDLVNVSGVDKGSSIFSFWLADPAYSNANGTVNFIGGSTSGFTGKSLEVLKVSFKVVGTGKADLAFTDGAVTASDGSGTNVLSSMTGIGLTSTAKQGAVVITPPPTQITRPATPSQNLLAKPDVTIPLYAGSGSWHNVMSNFAAQWKLPADVTDVATAVNKDPLHQPAKSEGLFDNKIFAALSDGSWYLHVRFRNSIGWGPTNHYQIGIDSAPPPAFEVSSQQGLDTSNVAPTITYEAQDQWSGIMSYTITIDGVLATTTTETIFTLSPQPAGNRTIIVEAQDNAGNKTASQIRVHIQEIPFFVLGGLAVTQFWFFAGLVMLLLLSMAGGWYLGRLKKEQRERRTVIAQRDLAVAFDSIKSDVDKILGKLETGQLTSTAVDEIKFTLGRMAESSEKMKRYIGENVEEINE